MQAAAEQAEKIDEVPAPETPIEAPVEASEAEAIPVVPVAEAPVIELPPLSPEMMELMGPSSSEKKRTRRGGRRRKTTAAETSEQK
jgi:hypothetical protein